MGASLTSQYWRGAKQIFGIYDFQNVIHCYKNKNYRGMTINYAKGAAKLAMFTLVSLGAIYGITKIFSVDKLDEFNRLYEDQKYEQAKAIISECLENTPLRCNRVNEQALSLLNKATGINSAYVYAEKCMTSKSSACTATNENAYDYFLNGIKEDDSPGKLNRIQRFADYASKCLEISSDTCKKVNEKAYKDLIPLDTYILTNYAEKCFKSRPDIFQKIYKDTLNDFLKREDIAKDTKRCLAKKETTAKCVEIIDKIYRSIYEKIFPISLKLEDRKKEVLFFFM